MIICLVNYVLFLVRSRKTGNWYRDVVRPENFHWRAKRTNRLDGTKTCQISVEEVRGSAPSMKAKKTELPGLGC
jgi:hypothetical protein